jgi:hypothetical protein
MLQAGQSLTLLVGESAAFADRLLMAAERHVDRFDLGVELAHVRPQVVNRRGWSWDGLSLGVRLSLGPLASSKEIE